MKRKTQTVKITQRKLLLIYRKTKHNFLDEVIDKKNNTKMNSTVKPIYSSLTKNNNEVHCQFIN